MAGRVKHMERSRRSYKNRQMLMQAAARSSMIRVQTNEIRKSKGGALANLIASAKNLMTHKPQSK